MYIQIQPDQIRVLQVKDSPSVFPDLAKLGSISIFVKLPKWTLHGCAKFFLFFTITAACLYKGALYSQKCRNKTFSGSSSNKLPRILLVQVLVNFSGQSSLNFLSLFSLFCRKDFMIYQRPKKIMICFILQR